MSVIDVAKEVISKEIYELEQLKNRIGEDFEKAVDLLLSSKSHIILSGIGKSGNIAQKISSTLSSTGSPSFFVHPTECSHGDLGMINKNSVLLIISNSGNNFEMKDLLSFCSRNNVSIVALTGKPDSDLGKAASVVLDTKVEKEACPFNLAPTTSTTVCLALGDALAIALLEKRKFKEEQYAELHPGGILGKRLLTRVKDVMHTGDTFPLVSKNTPMKEVISKMTAKEVRGVAGVVDENNALLGVITDGDLRRRMESSKDPLKDMASEVMTSRPKTIFSEELAERALFMMEEFSIQTLFVLKENTNQPIGLIHLQELLKTKIR